MKKHGFHVFLALAVALTYAEEEISTATTEQYLNRKLREIKVEIAKSYSSDPPPDQVYDVRWQRLWEKNVNSNYPLALSFSDETFVLANDRVLRVEVDVSDSEKTMLHEVAVISQQKAAKFVRTTTWKESLYLLICQDDGTCSLHVGPNANELPYRQIVKHQGLPMDAQFFTQANHLYLVVAANSGQFSVPSVIYRWTGTYMDVISEIPTTGAVSVATFNHKQSTILIFAQNVKDRPRIGSEVFKFKNGLVEKIQFLATDAPVSIHHYEYEEKIFLLIINEFSASRVFWWDGKEFLSWMELPEIQSPTKVNIVYVNDDTLLLVSQQNTLSLYRIMNLAYTKLNLLELEGYMITDFNARVKGKSIILVLVKKSNENSYLIEPVQLGVKKIIQEKAHEEVDATWEYLKQLEELLKERMPGVIESRESWPFLLPFSENIVVSVPLEFDNLVIDSGNILDLVVSNPKDILTPTELVSGLKHINVVADSLISQSSEFLFPNDTAELKGKIVVEGDAFFDEMHVDSLMVDVLNDQKVDFIGVLSYSKDQEFPDPLQGSVVTIQNLEINSLCGIPFENWQMKNESNRTTLDFFADDVRILNDTVLVQSDLSLGNLGALRMNNLNLKAFIQDLFIIGVQQEIKGSIFYKQGFVAFDLTMNATNGISADQLLTKMTDQQLEDILIKSLEIDDLVVERINNISVDEAARVSQKNIVSGQVTFRDLRITDELNVEGVSVLFDLRPIQIYDEVEIQGDLVIRNLDLISGSSLYLNNSKVLIDSLFHNCWTKSTNQTIMHNVTLTKGITIDDLQADYLNGYGEEDFLYTTATEISDKFGALYFKRFEIDGLLVADRKETLESNIVLDDTLIINQKIQITDLKIGNLNAQTYNKIPIEDIARGKTGMKISGTIKYKNVKVANDIRAGELEVESLNNKDMTSFFEQALLVDKDYTIGYLELTKLETDNIDIEELDGVKMTEFYRMLKYKDITAIKNVTIDGDLLVNGNIQVEFINNINSAAFIEILSNNDIELAGNENTFDKFVVFGNLNTNLLHGLKIEDLAENTLSKNKTQKITGECSFHKVQADNLIANEINGFNVIDNLKLISDPLVFEQDVVFSDLIVHGDIITAYFNGQDIAEIYDAALQVPFPRIVNLTISGNIYWEDSAKELKSLSYIFNNAVTKNTNQTIEGEVVFAECICAYRLTCSKNIGDVNISSIVLDTVIPTGQPLFIQGQKILTKGLTARTLNVSRNIDVTYVNKWDILDLNSTIVRKFDTQTISGATIFSKDVTIERMQVTGKVHGKNTQGIVTFNDALPSNTKFMNLDVRNEIIAKKLDGIDFEDFVKNRVTLNGNHEIYGDVVFLGPVVVTQNTVLSSINDIDMSDVALSGVKEPQIISGSKIMTRDFIVEGKLNVPTINNIGITEEFENGIFNNQESYINGNIIFSADLETHSNVFVDGLVNGLNLNEFSQDLYTESVAIVRNLERDQSYIDSIIDRYLNYTEYLQDVFFYFDIQPELLVNAPNIQKIQTLTIESMTKLNLYTTEKGRYCGLPDFCPCPNQYVAELLDYECKIWKINGSRIIYNAHDSEGRFGVNIISNTTSSSVICSQDNPASEFTTISWMTPKILPTGHLSGEIRNNSMKIIGYLSDVKTFAIKEKLYVVLAIYYVAELKSHNVNSLVYEIDLIRNEIILLQTIKTSGAVALDIFATELHGTHLLIACKNDPAESQLHRFNARNSKFELLRTFRTGGSFNVKSIIQGKESFVLLDDPLANAVHIFNYKIEFDNYEFYQSLYHESAVKDIEVFYAGEFGDSDAYVIVTTDEGRFFLYEYMFLGGFQLRAQQWLDGVQTMAAFHFSNRRYIFAGTVTNSTVYRIVEQGLSFYANES